MRRLILKNTYNTRDLGGYPTSAGCTRYGCIFRSDEPRGADGADIDALRAAGITTLIDLRSAYELRERPCALREAPGMHYHHCPLMRDDQMQIYYEGIGVFYMMLTENFDMAAAVLRAIAQAPGGVMYFCAAGKDRTGVTSALLLLLAGAGEHDVIADYILSQAYLKEALRRWEAERPEIPAGLNTPTVAYMEEFLALFHERYGSAEAYLAQIGLTDTEQQALRAKLV